MSQLPDWRIRELANAGMITPFADRSPPGVVSYGVTSYGYDARLGPTFRTPEAGRLRSLIEQGDDRGALDPKRSDPSQWHTYHHEDGQPFYLPAGGCVLAETVERFRIPRDVLAVVTGKSTYARHFVHVLVTPLEPEWEGTVTLEIVNLAPAPVRLYPGEGICQIVFHRAGDMLETCTVCNGQGWKSVPVHYTPGGESYLVQRQDCPSCNGVGHSRRPMGCEVSYADKRGKYQGQSGVTLGKV